MQAELFAREEERASSLKPERRHPSETVLCTSFFCFRVSGLLRFLSPGPISMISGSRAPAQLLGKIQKKKWQQPRNVLRDFLLGPSRSKPSTILIVMSLGTMKTQAHTWEVGGYRLIGVVSYCLDLFFYETFRSCFHKRKKKMAVRFGFSSSRR